MDWGCKGCCVSPLHVCPVRGVSFSHFPKVLVVLPGAISASLRSTLFFLFLSFCVSVVAAATLLTPRNCFWGICFAMALFYPAEARQWTVFSLASYAAAL